MRRPYFALGMAAALSTWFTGMSLVGCGSPGSLDGPGTVGPSSSSVGNGGDLGNVGNGGEGGYGGASAPALDLDAGILGVAGASGTGGEGPSGPPPTADANCGSVTSNMTRQPADVLLVLDRSSSMNYGTDTDSNCSNNDPNCTPRWPAVTSAVSTTLDSTAGSINWGLKFYTSPGGGRCGVDSGVEVPIAADSVATIKSEIAGMSPSNNTPTAQAIEAATAYLQTVDDTNGKYILLATDGEPNCAPGASSGTTNVPGTVDAIAAAAAAGFRVYVIGIGPSVGNLDNFASAGGTGNCYPATSPDALTQAFASISKLVATCTFTSDAPPPDLDNIAVYLNKALVPQDAGNGWSFGANTQTIVLGGTACDEAMSGNAQVQILFGCPGGPPPPQFIP
jgi:hypothetical protein